MISRTTSAALWLVATGAAVLAFALTACSAALPETVVAGTKVTVAWANELSSTNAAAEATAGNLDLAAVTRDGFGDIIDGEFLPDETFGKVSIVSDNPFVVRFDLAEPSWSDGVPLDAADLMLGWAAASGLITKDGQPRIQTGTRVVEIDEFARSIDVSFPQPTTEWQQAIAVAVPAHVVGQLAFGIDDAMAAKEAVITAIDDQDIDALNKLTKAWNTGFAVDGVQASDAALVSSGPFLIDKVTKNAAGQSIVLVPNAKYRGFDTPKVARINLVPAGKDPLSQFDDAFNVMQLAPTSTNAPTVDFLERRDVVESVTDDGTMWSVQVRPNGMFASQAARLAFLRAVPMSEVLEAGAQDWAGAYTATVSFTASPNARSYEIVQQDAGAVGSSGSDAVLERDAAGVTAGASVCVLYDRTSEFAVGAYSAMRKAATETGWAITDCSTDNYNDTLANGQWDAVIARTNIAQTMTQLQDQWSSKGLGTIIDLANSERDELITTLGRTTDIYEAREIRAQIEATIVNDAIALPITVNPRITIADKTVTGVAPRGGSDASLTSGMSTWEVTPK